MPSSSKASPPAACPGGTVPTVPQQCERPTCSEPASVSYGFDPGRCMAWLEPFSSGAGHGRLCRRHADAMVVPMGWWLDDRRSAEQLFTSQPPVPASSTPADVRARRAFRALRRPADLVALELAEGETEAPAPAPDGDDVARPVGVPDASDGSGEGAAVVAWMPTFVAGDDLDGVLNATSPLLARAFGRVKGTGTRSRPPARGA
jgi:hypothetical protein